MIYLCLGAPILLLLGILLLRGWLVFYTDHPVTNLETAARVFVRSFKENLAQNNQPQEVPYPSHVKFVFTLPPSEDHTSNLPLTEEHAEMIAEAVIRSAWKKAKEAHERGSEDPQEVL